MPLRRSLAARHRAGRARRWLLPVLVAAAVATVSAGAALAAQGQLPWLSNDRTTQLAADSGQQTLPSIPVVTRSMSPPSTSTTTTRTSQAKRSTSSRSSARRTSGGTQPEQGGGSATSAQCRADVWSRLEACGFPGPQNTGPRSGTVRRTVSGGHTVTANGTVITGWKVSGGIRVEARDVVIRDSWISNSAGGGDGTGVVHVAPGASAVIEYSVLDGRQDTHACIFHEGASMTARANECQGANDGVFTWAAQAGKDGTGDNFQVVGNYFHSFTTAASNGHVDGFQTEGAKHGVIKGNTFNITQDQNAAIAIWNGRKSSADITVSGNLIAGGGFSVFAQDYHPSESSPAGGYSVTDITFADNVFSTVHYDCVGGWGVWFERGEPSDGWQRSGNTVLETGQSVDSGNPTANGRRCD